MLKKPKVEKHAIKAGANKNATTMMETRPIKTSNNTSRRPCQLRKRETLPRATENTTIKSLRSHLAIAAVATVVVEEAVVAVSVEANEEAEVAEIAESEEEVDEAEVQQGDTTMTSMCSQASVPEIS